jgi:hypothetical protein
VIRLDLNAEDAGEVVYALRRYRSHTVRSRAALLRKFGPEANTSAADRRLTRLDALLDWFRPLEVPETEAPASATEKGKAP